MREALLGAALGALAGCAPQAPAQAAAPAGVAIEPGQEGSLHCRVRLAGRAPPRPRIHPDKNVEHCGASLEDSVLLVAGDAIQDAVAWLDLPGRADASAAGEELVLTNRGCLMEPRIQTAERGARLVLRNDDPITHNPHGWSERGLSTFNVTLLDRELEVRRTLKEPGVYRIDCDTHAWMHAYVHVFDHPFHARSDPAGSAWIRALPPGRHALRVWHEVLGEQAREVEIEEGRTTEVEVVFELVDRRPDKLVPPMSDAWIPRAPAERSRAR